MFFASKANFVIDNVHNGQEKNPSLINVFVGLTTPELVS